MDKLAHGKGKVLDNTYGEGTSLGHVQAAAWMENSLRGNPDCGGTLQHIILEYAKRFASARSAVQRARVRGEIVGFSYRLECPEHAIALDSYARKKRMEAIAPRRVRSA